MKLTRVLTVVALTMSLAGGTAYAQSDKAKKQAEVQKATAATLNDFYKQKAELKGMAEKAPGYGVFTTYGISFVVGGAGGKGIVHNNATKKDTYMDMAQASAGLQVGIAETKMLIVFKDAKLMDRFINSGWEVGGSGGAGAGAGDKSVGSGSGGVSIADSDFYLLTKNGVQAGGAVAGTKFWKDKDLN
jgi:lipid-binding SYLF domain-containing protein